MSDGKINLTIIDSIALDEFLQAVCRFASSAKFTLTNTGCQVMSNDDKKTVRAYFNTNCFISEAPVSFAIGDVRKFQRCISIITEEYCKGKKPVAVPVSGLCYNTVNTTLEFTGKVKFSIVTIDEKVIEKYVGRALKTEFIRCFGMVLSEERHRKLVSLSGINSSEVPKVYMYRAEDGSVMAEINNKTMRSSDAIAIPVAPPEKTTGMWNKVLIVKLDEFRNWMLLKEVELNIYGITTASDQPPTYVETIINKKYESGIETSAQLLVALQKM